MGWTPRAFWRATPAEFYAAVDGWLEARGVDTTTTPMGRDELEELMERFPDDA